MSAVQLYWPCYGVEGDTMRWPPHAYILEATEGACLDEVLPAVHYPMDELLAMVKASHYVMDLNDAKEAARGE